MIDRDVLAQFLGAPELHRAHLARSALATGHDCGDWDGQARAIWRAEAELRDVLARMAECVTLV